MELSLGWRMVCNASDSSWQVNKKNDVKKSIDNGVIYGNIVSSRWFYNGGLLQGVAGLIGFIGFNEKEKFMKILDLRLVVLVGVTVSASLLCNAAVVPYTADANTAILLHLNETSGSVAADSSGNGLNFTDPSTSGLLSANPGPGGLSTDAVFSSHEFGSFTLQRALSASEAASFDTNSFTMEAWLKNPGKNGYSGTANHNYDVFGVISGTATPQFGLRLYYNDGASAYTGSLQVFYNGTWKLTDAGSPIWTEWNDDTWHHIGISFDGGETGVNDGVITVYHSEYVEGEVGVSSIIAQWTGLPDFNPLAEGNTVTVGGMATNATYLNEFGGEIDEFRVSNAVLTANDFNVNVPEPATISLLVGGLGAFVLRKTRKIEK